jgi:hypothetical protein
VTFTSDVALHSQPSLPLLVTVTAVPSGEVARKAFDELLSDVRIENCVFFPQVVNALLRQAPARIEAENFGQEGPGKSFQVKELNHRSAFYRQSEPVPVRSEEGSRRQSSQYITLNAGDWTAYAIESRPARDYNVSIRARAKGGSAVIHLSANTTEQTVTVNQPDWGEINIGKFALVPGKNRLKLLIKAGAADVDWIDVTLPRADQQSATYR